MNSKIKKILFSFIIFTILAILIYAVTEKYKFNNAEKKDSQELSQLKIKKKIKSGDIIFQTSESSQSKAIQIATNSEYSHMGIIYIISGEYYVYEAIHQVKLTALNKWINRGKDKHYVIKRLKSASEILTLSTLNKMRLVGQKFKGKNYDLYFEWSNNKIYCSELVWKIYKEGANIEIGNLQKLSDFDLTNSIVKQKMQERYGDNIPLNEKVISPAEMFNSTKLITITKN